MCSCVCVCAVHVCCVCVCALLGGEQTETLGVVLQVPCIESPTILAFVDLSRLAGQQTLGLVFL